MEYQIWLLADKDRISREEEKEGYGGKKLQKRKVISLE